MRNHNYKSSYGYSDTNELQTSFVNHIAKSIFELTTNQEMGIHVDNSFDTQDIFSNGDIPHSTSSILNKCFINLNDQIDKLNNGRCVIYRPLKWKPYREWYDDELMFDNKECK